jgi:hypothetical protein
VEAGRWVRRVQRPSELVEGSGSLRRFGFLWRLLCHGLCLSRQSKAIWLATVVDEVASFFFLYIRIFCRAAAATKPLAQPSGYVPSWDWGGTAVSPQAAGEFSGPDRVCEVLFRVLAVIVRGLCVISFVLGSPCKIILTAGMNPCGPYRLKKTVVDNIFHRGHWSPTLNRTPSCFCS